MTSYATPRSPLRHIATPPLTSPTSARRHKEEVEELRTLQKKNSELRRALEQRKAYPWPSREARQRAREKEAELVEARKERIAEQKRKTEEKRSRKRRNEFRNAQYQVITNEHTVKSMSKKQLRQVKRTRVSQEGEIELVDAYAPTRDAKKPRR